MKTGRREVLTGMLGAAVVTALPALPAHSQVEGDAIGAGASPTLKLDFGGTTPAPAEGYTRALTTHTYTAARGWGWVSNTGLASRDRGGAPLQRDFVFLNTTAARVFRLGNLTPGRYRLTFVIGDLTFGDHYTRVQVPGIDGGQNPPVIRPAIGQFATMTLTAVVPVGSTTLDVTFDASQTNWVINALVLEPTAFAEPIHITFDMVPPVSKWGPILTSEDPTATLIAGHRARVAQDDHSWFRKTRLTRDAYLELITGEVDFWKSKQNSTTGAIIDPYRNVEFQYSTPAFAHAAATLVAYAGRTDLLEAAALALDWSASTLSARRAASGHEDFFAPMIAHSIRLLKPFVPAERSAAWEYNIWFFEPFLVYRGVVGTGGNWNVVAASGEALFQMMGIRDASHKFAEASFAGQGADFNSAYGLYLEGPMPYDHFPRLWVGDLLGRGYTGPYYQELSETMRRGALTSLFMQSPVGEGPAGGRSAHHQWNEAQQCVTFEIYAAKALAAGDEELAGYFKRAAHVSLWSMRRWVRPSGEMQIVKNWVDPSLTHGYETYSGHSQYNLLPMSMLAIAYEHAETTERVDELPSPADLGGYVLEIKDLHKIFANCCGTYLEFDTVGDHHYDATGLIRVHFAGHLPQLGPSDSILSAPSYLRPAGSPVGPNTGVGSAWKAADGTWLYQGDLQSPQLQSVTVVTTEANTEKVAFKVTYQGDLGGGVTAIEDSFVLDQDEVEMTTVLTGYTGTVRQVFPVLSHDGKSESEFEIKKDEIRVSQPEQYGSVRQTFEAKNASSVSLGQEQYPNHNGWARLGVAEYVPGENGNNGKGKGQDKDKKTAKVLVIKPQGGRPNR